MNGTPFPGEASVAPYRYGGEGRTVIIMRDTSEHEPTQGSRWPRDIYEALLNAQSDVGEGFLVVENERIRYVNEAFCLISGYSAGELTLVPTFLELVVTDQRSLIADWMHQRLRGEAVEACFEATILHKTGRHVELDIAVRPLPSKNQPCQLVAVVRDITERKRLEQKLQSSLSALVAVHEAGRVLSSTLKQKEIGARLLSTMLRICDLSAAVIELQDGDRPWEVLAAVGPESVWKTASAAVEVRVARLRALKSKKHQPFWCGQPVAGTRLEGLCLPLVVRGQVIGMLEVYGLKVLAEKATIEILESLARHAGSALENARLYQKVAEHERRLQDLVGNLLVAREEERRRVAYDIHDGLTQLAVAAHQNLQVYMDEHPPSSPVRKEKLNRTLQLTKRTVEEARRVIANLRPTALDDLGLAAALQLQVDSLRSEGWEITYEEDLWEECLPAEIETSLYGIVQEALTNVRKHAGTTRVHITLMQLSEGICLRVRDWGCGFDLALPLQEGNVPGEQVGLCSMQERIALLGGEFTIHSQPGVGTCAVAEIPLPHATPDQVKQIPIPPRKTSPTRLLIADDHALVREGLRIMLASEPDLEIVGEAADGREALERCRRLRPELILMDVRMPKLDGLAATRAIKAENPATVILMLTAHENPDHLREAVGAGAAGFIIKDATKHDLVGAVRRALSGENPLDQELAMQLLQRVANEEDRQEIGSPPVIRGNPEPLPGSLTVRELEVLQLLALGQTNRQISQKLVVSPATVKVHVEHIIAKFGVSSRTQAAVRANEIGLLASQE
jgi:PAS domain S-box-containing protein